MGDITQLLSQIESGDPKAKEQLWRLVDDELRKLADRKMADEKPGHTLQATALVNEVFIKLVESEQPLHFETRGHFFAFVVSVMRRILVDHARRRGRFKRGGAMRRQELDDVEDEGERARDELLDLNERLEKLAQEHPREAEVATLDLWGFSNKEIAEKLGISISTVAMCLRYARAWLRREMHTDDGTSPEV